MSEGANVDGSIWRYAYACVSPHSCALPPASTRRRFVTEGLTVCDDDENIE
mgnify:CR=1 FL=1